MRILPGCESQKEKEKESAGPRGPKGDTGEAATIVIDSVVTIEPNDPARVENLGDEFNARLRFYIPKGDRGNDGEAGESGSLTVTASIQTKIASHSPAEIMAAVQGGKMVYLNYDGKVLPLSSVNEAEARFILAENSFTHVSFSIEASKRLLPVSTMVLQTRENMTNSIAGNETSTTRYPTAKAVADYVAEHGGSSGRETYVIELTASAGQYQKLPMGCEEIRELAETKTVMACFRNNGFWYAYQGVDTFGTNAMFTKIAGAMGNDWSMTIEMLLVDYDGNVEKIWKNVGGGSEGGAVTSVNSMTGDVVLTADNVGYSSDSYHPANTVGGQLSKLKTDTEQELEELGEAIAELGSSKASVADVRSLYATVLNKADQSTVTAMGTEVESLKESLGTKANASDVYTKAEIDTLIGGIDALATAISEVVGA